jgi:NodT family efflux transporter outer membrane factor (OMF) lipoprotein
VWKGKIIKVGLCFIGLTNCTVGPTYKQPELTMGVPDAWHQQVARDFTQDKVGVQSWWQRFKDPILIAIIIEAEEQNISLQMATSSLRQARASYGVAASQFVPDISANGSVQREQSSAHSPSHANFSTVNSKPVNDFSVGLDASWEIDLWGGISKNVEAASATYGAELEQYRDTLISLRAEVASSYINVRKLQIERELTAQYNNSLRQLLALIESQYEQGTISKSDLEQERAAYDQDSTALPNVEMKLQQEYARLAVLLGTDVQSIESRLSTIAPLPRAIPTVAVGIPADLIRRRPDIRNAERNLAAQTAIVGSTMSDLYPKLSLSGAFGYEATKSSNLIQWSSRTYGFGPTVSWDIFNGDRIKSQIQLQEEKMNEAFLNWELTVLHAFAEVETAMSNLILSGRVQDSMNDAARSLLEAYELTEQEFSAGIVQMQTVLQAEQNYINAQIALVERTGTVSQNLVLLYKSLGGDWENGPPPDVQPLQTKKITQEGSAQ